MTENMRRISVLTVTLAVSLTITPIFIAKGEEIFDGQTLENLANKLRAFVPKDEFDNAPEMSSVSGKRYTYTIAPLKRGPDNLICDGFPSWSYYNLDKKLEIGDLEGLLIRRDLRLGNRIVIEESISSDKQFVLFRSLRCKKENLPSYIATNAYGAKVTVFDTKETVTAIGDFGMSPDLDWKTSWSSMISGVAARTLTKNALVRISGRLENWAPGQPVLCGVVESLPRVDSPFRNTLDICLFRGRADLFEVLDSSTGSVLYSTSRK